jgi:hypothetical protein
MSGYTALPRKAKHSAFASVVFVMLMVAAIAATEAKQSNRLKILLFLPMIPAPLSEFDSSTAALNDAWRRPRRLFNDREKSTI